MSLSTLADESFILFPAEMGPIFYDQIIDICQQAGFRPKVAQEAVQMQTIIGLVQQDWASLSFPPPCKTSTEAESFTDPYKSRYLKPDFILLGGSMISHQ